MENLFLKIFKKSNCKARPIISFEIRKEVFDYVIIIRNTGDTDGIINSLKCDYNTFPFMIKPKLNAQIGVVIHPQQEVTIDMPSALGTNFIDALSKFDFSYAMPKLIMHYSDINRNKYKAEYFFVGKEKL